MEQARPPNSSVHQTTSTTTSPPPQIDLTTNLSLWKTTKASSLTCKSLCLSNRLPFLDYSEAHGLTSSFHFSHSYVPRKCSATNRIIKAKDHASVQISIGKVDENGRYTGQNQVYALSGFVRARGEGDDSLNRLAQRDGLLKNVWSGSSQR